MTTMDMNRVIDDLGTEMDLTTPADDRELAAAAAAIGRPLPEELEALFRRGGFGARLDQVDFFSRNVFGDVAQQGAPNLPSAVFFASDGSDGHFFVDADDSLGRGTGAVYWSDRGVQRQADCIPCAGSVAEFLRDLAKGNRAWFGPSLRDLAIADMKQALVRHAPALTGARGPAKPLDLHQSALRVGVRFPAELDALLEQHDGLAFPAVGITLLGTAGLAPVADAETKHGFPGAIWFGEDRDGTRYAVTVAGWRDPDGGRVLRVAPGQSPAQAPLGDPLPLAIVGWLEQGAKN